MADDYNYLGGAPAPTESEADTARKRKLAALPGLKSLYDSAVGGAPSDEQASMVDLPLHGGQINRNIAAAGESAEEPSQLSTERVQRAPAMQEASPLLSNEERMGNVFTGETAQNTYQPLTQDQRKERLQDYFKQGAGAQTAEGTSHDVGGVGGGAGAQAKEAINYAKMANQFGSKLGKSLSDLFGGDKRIQSAVEQAAPAAFAQYGQGYEDLGDTIMAAPGIFNGVQPMGGFSTDSIWAPAGIFNGVQPMGPTSSAAGATAGGIGSAIGPIAGGIGGALSLASLINSMASGDFDNSKTGAIPTTLMNTAISLLPAIQSLIGPAAAGVSGGLGLSGIGLAATPMLIPAIKSIIDMFKDPKLPYNSTNMAQFKSRSAADQIPGQINDWLLSQNDPMSLLGLATGMRQLSPNQEVMMYAGGNPWGTDAYNTMLDNALQGGAGSQAMQDFLRSVELRSGETGGAHQLDQLATDTYRRQLAHALGLTSEATQGMFQTDPFRLTDQSSPGSVGSIDPNAWDIHQRMQNTMNSLGQFDTAQLQDLFNTIPSYAADSYSDFGHTSPYYQDPMAGRLTPEDVTAYQGLIQQAIDRQNIMNGTMPTTDPYLLSLLAAGYGRDGGDGGGDGGGGF